VDALDAKADAIAALEAAGAGAAGLQTYAGPGGGTPGWYHPGRSGVLKLGNQVLAAFGELHPAVVALMVEGDRLTTEPAFAYDCATDTARELGHVDRRYRDLAPYEIPGTMDLLIFQPGRDVDDLNTIKGLPQLGLVIRELGQCLSRLMDLDQHQPLIGQHVVDDGTDLVFGQFQPGFLRLGINGPHTGRTVDQNRQILRQTITPPDVRLGCGQGQEGQHEQLEPE
jgi:hypothetical protein